MATEALGIEQTVFTSVAPVRPGALASLRAELRQRQRARVDHQRLEQAGRCHCARLVLLEPSRSQAGHYFGPRLVFSSWLDGPSTAHVSHVSRVIPDLLDAALSHCDGFESYGRLGSSGAREGYLYAHAVRSKAAYNSARLRSVGQIRAESALASELQSRAQQLLPSSAEGLFDELLSQARAEASLAWAFAPPARYQLTAREKTHHWLAWLTRTAPQWLLFFASVRQLRRSERAAQQRRARADSSFDSSIPPEQAGRDGTSNAYNSIACILPGGVRQRALTLFLDLLQTVGRQRTDLSGITSMRFAHWCTIDHDSRLLFCSMYDGAWESYMADFVHLAGWGLTGVWSNTHGYPDTDYLVLNGARDEKGFRRFVREREVESAFWFRAYPGIAGENIQDNSVIREGLSRPLANHERAHWLSLL